MFVVEIKTPDHQSNDAQEQIRNEHLQDVIGDEAQDRVSDVLLQLFVIHGGLLAK